MELEKEQLEADLRFKSKELSGVVMTNIAHRISEFTQRGVATAETLGAIYAQEPG